MSLGQDIAVRPGAPVGPKRFEAAAAISFSIYLETDYLERKSFLS